jgi:hypothetical protein
LKKCFFNKIRQVGDGQSGRVWIMSGRDHITIPSQKSKYFKSIGDFDGKVVTKFVHLFKKKESRWMCKRGGGRWWGKTNDVG